MRKLLSLVLFASAFVASAAKEYPESNFLQNPRQLVYEGKRSGEGYFSPDGKKIIFQSERLADNPFYQIFILDFETGDVSQVSPGTGKTTCPYFEYGGGKRILYSSSHLDPNAVQKQKDELEFRASGKKRRYAWDYEPEMDVFSADQDGKNIKRLTSELGYDAEACYSVDGKKIIYSSNAEIFAKKNLTADEKKKLEMDPSYFCDLFIMDADGKNKKKITNTPGYDGGPFFSYDGKKIIWRRFAEDGHSADVFTADLDGSNPKQITDFGSMSWAPFFHPSGEYIIFASNKYGFGNFEIFIVDKDGTKEPVRITNTEGFDGLAVFSPDGKNLCWTSARTKDASAQLFYAGWNHTAALAALAEAPARKKSLTATNFTPEIKADEMRAKVEYLASDELEGRMTGSEGTRLAANYIITQFEKNGIKPLGDKGYKYEFDFVKKIEINESQNSLNLNGKELKLYTDFTPDVSSESGKVEAEMVFAGYGIKTSTSSDITYNNYKDLDVKDKIVVIFDGLPENLKPEERKSMMRHSDLMYKVMTARELGAKGILVVSKRNVLPRPTQRSIPAKTGLFLANISKEVAATLFAEKKLILDTVYSQLSTLELPKFASFSFDKAKVSLAVNLEKKMSQDYNIVGMIPATKKSDEYIFMGAHYDHIGHGETSSRAEDKDKHEIHNGADDNASGTSLVMEMVEYYSELKKTKPEIFTKNLVFGFWSGEELGLLGSEAFITKKEMDLKKVSAYMNFDMVGMLKDNKLSAQGIGSSPDWKRILEKKNIVAGFDLALQEDPYIPSDGMAFYKANVPMLALFTGLHDHYHHPQDDAANLNYDGMERIGKFASLITTELLKMDKPIAFATVEMSQGQSSSARSFGVSIGTIPDYGSDAKGMKITGVRANSAAEKAGLKGGDIIIKLAGKVIQNIYDYTNLLGEIKAGEKYPLVIIRDGKEMNLEVIPGVANH